MHAIARAKERYGLEITYGDLRAMEGQCRDKATVMKDMGRSRVHLVEHAGVAMKAVYDPESRIIVTFLAKDHNIWNKKRPGKQPRRKNVKRHCAGKGTKQ